MFIHRGLIEKNFRENHITSFKECIKKKFNIETDIHFTQNNTPICFHDYSLNSICLRYMFYHAMSLELKLQST